MDFLQLMSLILNGFYIKKTQQNSLSTSLISFIFEKYYSFKFFIFGTEQISLPRMPSRNLLCVNMQYATVTDKKRQNWSYRQNVHLRIILI